LAHQPFRQASLRQLLATNEGPTCLYKTPCYIPTTLRLGKAPKQLPGRGNHVDLLRSLRGSLILVVEDDPLIALDLTATLERAGVVVLGPAGRLNDAMLLAEKAFQLPLCLMCAWRLGRLCLSLNGLPIGTFRSCFRPATRLSSMPHIRPLLCCAKRSGPSS
jgi:hypothetical protein